MGAKGCKQVEQSEDNVNVPSRKPVPIKTLNVKSLDYILRRPSEEHRARYVPLSLLGDNEVFTTNFALKIYVNEEKKTATIYRVVRYKKSNDDSTYTHYTHSLTQHRKNRRSITFSGKTRRAENNITLRFKMQEDESVLVRWQRGNFMPVMFRIKPKHLARIYGKKLETSY